MNSDGTMTNITLSTINPNQFKDLISRMQLFINIPRASVWNGIKLEYRRKTNIVDNNTINWTIEYRNPSLLETASVELKLYVVAFQKSKDRRKWTQDGLGRYDEPLFRTPFLTTKLCRKNYDCSFANDNLGIINPPQPILHSIPRAVIDSLPVVIKWNHWEIKLSDKYCELKTIKISNKVMISLINSRNIQGKFLRILGAISSMISSVISKVIF